MNSQEAYPQLLSLAVHEFRTPASVVGGYLRMLLRDSADPLTERQRKMLDEAEKSCARLVALVAELSEISKLDAGTIALASQPLDLFTLVGEVAEHVHEAKDRDVLLEVRGDAGGAPSETRDGRGSAVIVIAEEPNVCAAYTSPAGPFDEKRGGLGLALPIARRVIEGHGGRLWAPASQDADDPLARGSAIISIPVTEQAR